MGRFSSPFPDTSVSEKEKNEQWYKNFLLGIIGKAIDGRYDVAYTCMQQSYDYYDGTQGTDAYNFLQTSESGDTLPAVWINYNKIRVKVDTLLGELSAKGFDIRVSTIDKESKSAKLDKKYELLGKMNIRKDLEELEQISGVPTAGTKNLPETEDELEDYLTHDWKDVSERVMTAALKFLIKKYKWQATRLSLFRDLLISGRCFVKTSIIDGLPRYKKIDPRYMIIDTSATDDFLTDATYFGHVEYMPLAEAVQVFQLTEKEIEEIKTGGDSNGNLMNPIVTHSKIGDSSLGYVTGTGDDLKVMVFSGEFQDHKKLKRRKSVDKYGTEHFKKVKDSAKGDDIVSKEVKVWRKGTLIGGKVMRDWGVKENMPSSVDDIYETKSSYNALCHNFINARTISKVQLMEGLQDSKNMALYNMQLALNRAGSKGFTYDISMLPDGWNIEDALYYLKTAGIAIVNSKQNGIHIPGQPLSEFDLTISQTLSQYIAVSQMFDKEMEEITGVNGARTGVIESANQAVGVTQAAIASSQLSTETLHEAFREFSQNVMNDMAGLVKISWTEKEVYAPIIGDVGVDFINQDIDLALHDYGTFVEMTPPLFNDKQQFTNMINNALNAQKIEIEDALDLIRENDPDLGIRRLKRAINKRERDRQQAQQAAEQQQIIVQQQAQQASEQQLFKIKQIEEQLKGQRMNQQSQLNGQNKMALQSQKHQQELEKLSMQERINITNS